MKAILISAIWCPSCLIMKSLYQKIWKQYPSIIIEHIDYDDEPDKVVLYKVGTILPVLIFIDEDTEILRIVGEKSKKEVARLLEDIAYEKH
jgi:thiol-disulfide isomerase/thioredoxin